MLSRFAVQAVGNLRACIFVACNRLHHTLLGDLAKSLAAGDFDDTSVVFQLEGGDHAPKGGLPILVLRGIPIALLRATRCHSSQTSNY